MKNIHVLPTEKPSRLFVTDGKLFNYHKPQKGDGIKIINQNIYITSDEPAYPYALHLKNREVFKTRAVGSHSLELYHDKGFSYPEECKKIILTTDQDLIKDGVQAIDDDFLEWFVKNPSCESVKVNNLCYGALGGFADAGYKIIIPKEEAKQEMPQIGTKEFNDLASAYFGGKPKQETLEEAAKRFYTTEDTKRDCNFIEGAKWQQEQDKNKFSEEDMLKMLHKFGFDYTYNYKVEKLFMNGYLNGFQEYKRLEQLKNK